MEALSSINSNAEIKQPKAIVIEQSNKEVCKNRIEMPFDDLLKDTIKKLMPYAMFLTYKNDADSWDLVQHTILKLIKNKDKFLEHPKNFFDHPIKIRHPKICLDVPKHFFGRPRNFLDVTKHFLDVEKMFWKSKFFFNSIFTISSVGASQDMAR